MLVLTVLIILMVTVVQDAHCTVTVKLNQGLIEPFEEIATDGRIYYSFRNIPYAKQPVGPLRFQDPQPAEPWNSIWNFNPPIPIVCPQSNEITNSGPIIFSGQEDCLYLNVYTPKPLGSDLPVMVNFHGGFFLIGSAGEGGGLPDPLMQKDVVVVTLNYRLGALGFVTTEDSVLPGNLGLKDQALALQWVHNNIQCLGGDPHKVTIFGNSAGGISAHLHVLSPTSQGLFQRAILQSGTALLFSDVGMGRKGAISIANALNCAGEESNQLLECFMNATAEELVMNQNSGSVWNHLPLTVGPTIDGTFLPDHPLVLLRSGNFNKVDIMIGSSRDDGNIFTAGLFSQGGQEALSELINNFNEIGPVFFGLTEEENPIHLARRISFNYDYIPENNVTLNDEPALTDIITDVYFEALSCLSAEIHSWKQDVFMYQFDHAPEKSFFPLITMSFIQREMAGHRDELLYLFEFLDLPPLVREEDFHVQEILVTLWTNFAATGKPTPYGTLGFRWIPVTKGYPLRYLSITTNPEMQDINREICNFWKHLPINKNKLLNPELFARHIHDCPRQYYSHSSLYGRSMSP